MSVLTLGKIEFRIDELPEEINFGGEHTLAVRKFPGGGIDVQALGSFEDDISWSGVFRYQDAKDRLLAVGQMRINANPVALKVSFITRTVIVKSFKYKYINDFYIPYEIVVQPLVNCTVNGSGVQSVPIVNSASSTATTSQNTENTYRVVQGDTLWGIAAKFYRDGSKWPVIAQINNIKNPKGLQIGTLLKIPKI